MAQMRVPAVSLSERIDYGRDTRARMGEPHRQNVWPDEFASDHSAGCGHLHRGTSRTERRTGKPTGFLMGSSLESHLSAGVVATRLEGCGKGGNPGHGSGLNLPAHCSSWSLRTGTAHHRDRIGNCSLRSYSRPCQSHRAQETNPGPSRQDSEGLLTAEQPS